VRKTIAAIILGFVWIGYIVWPLYDLMVLGALRRPPIHTVALGVYFDAVRASLTSQVVAVFVRREDASKRRWKTLLPIFLP
jgi:hypothetical protein